MLNPVNAEENAETIAEKGTAADSDAAPTDVASETPGDAQPSDEIQVLRNEISELKNEVLRARADVDNARKRAERDVEAAHKYGQERFAQQLLPVKDSIDLGLDAASTATDLEGIKEGMAMSAKMFGEFFTKLQIHPVNPQGERFDPEFHQAMMTEAANDVEPGTVLRVMQTGYLLNDRLLRPALVVVSKVDDA